MHLAPAIVLSPEERGALTAWARAKSAGAGRRARANHAPGCRGRRQHAEGAASMPRAPPACRGRRQHAKGAASMPRAPPACREALPMPQP